MMISCLSDIGQCFKVTKLLVSLNLTNVLTHVEKADRCLTTLRSVFFFFYIVINENST